MNSRRTGTWLHAKTKEMRKLTEKRAGYKSGSVAEAMLLTITIGIIVGAPTGLRA